MKKQLLLFLVCSLAAGLQLISQNVYYVRISGSDSNDGLTWETAYSTIQHAINQSHSNDNGYEVWVAEGTYIPTECLSDYYGLQTEDVYKSFVMYSDVNVYGGFAGTETTNEIGVSGGRELASENPWDFVHETILDGSTTNSYHVVWYGSNGFIPFDYEINEFLTITMQIPAHLPEKTILNGFSITGGFANMDIILENTDESKANYCHVSGGGIALVGNGEVDNCKVYSNKAKYSGAGVGMFNGAEMYNTLVNDNECVGVNFYSEGLFGIGARDYWLTNGAGVGSFGSEDYMNIIENCVVSNNLGQANDNYPGIANSGNNKYNEGGGIYMGYTTMTNTLIIGNQITKNPSPYDNGASASCGAGVFLYPRGTVDSCEITDNGFTGDSQNGAGIFMADYENEATISSDLVLMNSYIHSNNAGGAVCVDAQYSTVENCIVANNIGVGIYGFGNCNHNQTINCLSYNNSSLGWGHSSSDDNSDNEIINSTIVNNGIGISVGNSNSHKIYNTVVWGNNSNPEVYSNLDVKNCAFSFVPPAGVDNIQIAADNALGPDFVNPTSSNGINISGWENADWHIGANSALIDKGDYDLVSQYMISDIEGEVRQYGLQNDIGAYESKFGGPYIELSEVLSEYTTYEDVEVRAEIYSNGYIDNLCGIGYEIYKDDVLIENVADYGTLTYTVRQIGDSYYEGTLTEGSGMIDVTIDGNNVGAFTLGLFDNYCVNRNRPIDFTANFNVSGVYKIVATINSCTSTVILPGSTYIATNCDGLEHYDMVGETCENPIELSSKEVTITIVDHVAPYVEFSEIQTEYAITDDIDITASIYSNNLIDNLCGIGYELYKDSVLIDNLADYGTLTYTVRQAGDTYYEGTLTEGTGMIDVAVGGNNIGAFTLGIFDNYCVNRNRPINFTANFDVPGVYNMVSTIYTCGNIGISTGTSFIATNCDGEEHLDMIGETCENPIAIADNNIEITVRGPEIELTEILEEYNLDTDIDVTASIYSHGFIDNLCGIGYEMYKDGVLIENLADYGTLTYTVRQIGNTYYDGTLTEGSGMIDVTVGLENVGAFTLGLFDNYCVNRNRPIEFTANLTEPGEYSMVSTIYSCSNAGSLTGGSYTATNCDGEEHYDYTAETCDNPDSIASETIAFTILGAIKINTQPLSQTICEYEFATLTIDAETTLAETLTYQWYSDGEIVEGKTNSNIEVNLAGEYYCVLTVGQNELISQIATVEIYEVNPVLEPVISACNGTSVELNPGDFETYEWQDSFDEQIYEATTTGVYSVTVTDENGCSANTSTEITFGDEIVIYWEESTTLCEGSSVDLIAPESEIYEWADGEDTQELEVTEEGWYYVTITQSTCSGNDSIFVEVVDLPEEFDLGAAITVCDVSATLNAPEIENVDYLWTTMETTSSIEVIVDGIYGLTIINANGCERYDEQVVAFGTELDMNLYTSDTINSCGGLAVLLECGDGNDFSWSNGNETSSISVTEPEWYCVTVSNDYGCEGIDSVYVNFYPIHSINLGSDEEFCSDLNTTLNAPSSVSWIWSTDETTQNITVDETGFYSCTITDENGCQNTDTVGVIVHEMPNVDLGSDISVNNNINFVLGVDVGDVIYLWSNGESTSHIVIDPSTLSIGDHAYSVTVTTLYGCVDSDEIIVTVNEGSSVVQDIAENITLTPNPTLGLFIVSGKNIKNIKIYDNIGKLVLITKQNEIDMSKYPSGLYFVKIAIGNNIITRKLIKE